MAIPVKPFPSYKWRWLSWLPTEGLLRAPVFLGVLRALHKHQGYRYSSTSLRDGLHRVQIDTGTDISLARNPDRNLFRNSGQYWRGTGLLASRVGVVQLTELGQGVATGDIPKDQFVALMVRNTVLPNPQTYSPVELEKWRKAGLRIKPFELILAVMDLLGKTFDVDQAFLTPQELISVVIPLAGQETTEGIAESIHALRLGNLDVSSWPNCAPRSNDRRLAREFLLFLENFGVCRTDGTSDRYRQRFLLDQVLSDDIQPNVSRSFLEDDSLVDEEVAILNNSEIPKIIERRRVLSSRLERPTQSSFRKRVLAAAGGQCILTDETTHDVLEAAHIVPVEDGGIDAMGNGLCMRVDVHRLFDSGKVRIGASGTVALHKDLVTTASYSGLPQSVVFPLAVKVSNVAWRERYL